MDSEPNKGDAQLRKALDLEGTFVHEHRQRVEEIDGKISHTIVFIETGSEELPWASGAPCVPYALGFASNPDFWQITQSTNVHARGDFVVWLIEQGHLQEIGEPEPGTLVLYFAEAQWQHIGIVTAAARIRSKWGTFPVYEHALWEVPNAYGNAVRYYRRPNPNHALELFDQFVSEKQAEAAARQR